MTLDWKIVYDGDGLPTFSSDDGTPHEAPAWGVLAIVAVDRDPNGVGRYVVYGRPGGASGDYYWHENGEWYAGDFVGLIDFLARSGIVKFGRTVSNERFREALRKATGDPDFLPIARPPA